MLYVSGLTDMCRRACFLRIIATSSSASGSLIALHRVANRPFLVETAPNRMQREAERTTASLKTA